MRHYHCTEYEPLLKGVGDGGYSNGSITRNLMRQIPTKKEISESIHREQSKLGSSFRSNSFCKWYILFSISICWLSTYFNSIYFPLPLNNKNDYQYITSITYILAVFTPLFIPRILLFFNGSSIISLICIQFISLFGEILFYFGLQQKEEKIILLLYIGRIFIGISLGFNDSVILSILIFWFQKAQKIAFSSIFIFITTLFPIIFIYLFKTENSLNIIINNNNNNNNNNNLFIDLIPILINFISIWILFIINCIKNKNIPPIYDQIILRDFYKNGNILKKLKKISNILWLNLLNLSLTLSLINILYTIFIPNVLMEIYNFTEKESLNILLLTLCFIILWSLPISYIIDYYGYYIQWNILSTFLFFLSLLFLYFGGINDNNDNNNNKIYSIISLCIFAISTLFISSHFSLLILSTKPIELSPYISSIITILYWFFTVIFNDIIIWLNNLQIIISNNFTTFTYLDSILFILFISFLQFVISAISYGISVKSQLNLHHPLPNKITNNV